MELQINTELDLGDVYWIFYAGKVRNIVINDFSIDVNRDESKLRKVRDWFDWTICQFRSSGIAPKSPFKLKYTYYGRVTDFQDDSYHRIIIHKDENKNYFYVTDNSHSHRILYRTKEELLATL